MLSLQLTCGFLALLGALSHLLYFRHGEHLKAAPTYIVSALLAPLLAFSLLVGARGIPLLESYLWTTATWWAFMGGLFTSIALYRLLAHPLSSYGGPFWARITQFYLPVAVAEKANSAWYIHSLHEKYGEYFRLGPNLLSISDPDAVDIIHAPGTKFGKGQWYDLGHPLTTIQQMREKHVHDKRKRDAWDPAFTPKALRNYDPRIMKHVNQLMAHLKKIAGQKVNASTWFGYFTFDVMGIYSLVLRSRLELMMCRRSLFRS